MELWLYQRSGLSGKVPVSGVRWQTRIGGAGILEFSAPWVGILAAEGDRVRLLRKGQAVFDGFVFQTERDGRGQRVLCYDRVKYLLYKDTKVFRNRTAGEIAGEILKERQRKTGGLAEAGDVLNRLAMEGQTLLQMIRKALEETRAATGKEFVLYDNAGEMVLREAAENPAGVLLCGENQVLSYQEKSDIDGGTFNRFKIWQ